MKQPSETAGGNAAPEDIATSDTQELKRELGSLAPGQ